MPDPEPRQDHLRIRVSDLTGARTLDAAVPPDAPVAAAYGRLAERFGARGEAARALGIGVALFHRRSRLLLSPEITFAAAGVETGDTLILVPVRDAGKARPAPEVPS